MLRSLPCERFAHFVQFQISKLVKRCALPVAEALLPLEASTASASFPFSQCRSNELNDALFLATYYDPNGGTGACGSVLQNSDFIVALGTGNWDGGAHCGQTVNVQCAYLFVL